MDHTDASPGRGEPTSRHAQGVWRVAFYETTIRAYTKQASVHRYVYITNTVICTERALVPWSTYLPTLRNAWRNTDEYGTLGQLFMRDLIRGMYSFIGKQIYSVGFHKFQRDGRTVCGTWSAVWVPAPGCRILQNHTLFIFCRRAASWPLRSCQCCSRTSGWRTSGTPSRRPS